MAMRSAIRLLLVRDDEGRGGTGAGAVLRAPSYRGAASGGLRETTTVDAIPVPVRSTGGRSTLPVPTSRGRRAGPVFPLPVEDSPSRGAGMMFGSPDGTA